MKFLIIDAAPNTGMSFARFKEICNSSVTEDQFKIKDVIGLDNLIVFIPEHKILEELSRHITRRYGEGHTDSKDIDYLVGDLNASEYRKVREFRAFDSNEHDYGCADGLFFQIADISIPNAKSFEMVQKYSFNSITCCDPKVWGNHPELDDISDEKLLDKHKEMFSMCGVVPETLKIEKIECDGWNNLSARFTISTRLFQNLLQMVYFTSMPFENRSYDLFICDGVYRLDVSHTYIQDTEGNFYQLVEDEYENFYLNPTSYEETDSLSEEDIKTFNNIKLADSGETESILGVSIKNINLVKL